MMRCPRCGQENHADARFCERCDAPLGGGRVIARPDLIPADRSARVAAKIIDLPFTVASVLAASLVPSSAPSSEAVQLGLILVGVFGMIAQTVLLSNDGQTIGKKVMKLKIVRADTGRNGGFVTNVLLRAVINGLLAFTTLSIYFVADTLFIFSRNRLCLHDYVAGDKGGEGRMMKLMVMADPIIDGVAGE